MIYEFECENCKITFINFVADFMSIGEKIRCPQCNYFAVRIPSLPYLPRDIKTTSDYWRKSLDADAEMRHAYKVLEERGQLNEVDDSDQQDEVLKATGG